MKSFIISFINQIVGCTVYYIPPVHNNINIVI